MVPSGRVGRNCDGAEVWRRDSGEWERRCEELHGYCRQGGGAYVVECLATGVEPLMTGDHALDVLGVMTPAKRSALTGACVPVTYALVAGPR